MMIFPIIGATTFLLVASFLLFFMASKTSGLTATFGRILGFWLLLIAAIGMGGVATALMNGGRPFGIEMPMMRGDRMRCCQPAQLEPAPLAAPSSEPVPTTAPATGSTKPEGGG